MQAGETASSWQHGKVQPFWTILILTFSSMEGVLQDFFLGRPGDILTVIYRVNKFAQCRRDGFTSHIALKVFRSNFHVQRVDVIVVHNIEYRSSMLRLPLLVLQCSMGEGLELWHFEETAWNDYGGILEFRHFPGDSLPGPSRSVCHPPPSKTPCPGCGAR